jgi:glycosyltransferase involved in cell wall biosynthesis
MKLVSAIMPTRGRKEWAAQALKCFLDQTYPEKELIILDDMDDRSFDEKIGFMWPDVRYFVFPGSRFNIPYKRNRCCEVAHGETIMHWDSDDWSAPDRMANQVSTLEESGRQVTGFHSMLFYEEHSGRCFKYLNDESYALGTSLTYLKSFWQSHPFNETLKDGEDNQFVKEAMRATQLVSVDAGQLMVARIHPNNTSPKDLGGTQTSYVPVPRETLPEGFFR